MKEIEAERRALRRMSRLELVDLVYQLRKSNEELEDRCTELEALLKKDSTVKAENTTDVTLRRIELMLRQLCNDMLSRQLAENKLRIPTEDKRNVKGNK